MNSRQKEVELAKLKAEAQELKQLKKTYEATAKDIAKKLTFHNGKINALLANLDNLDEISKSILQSQIYQRNFQLSLKSQIDGFLRELNNKQYSSIDEYLQDCYETGYIGSMYDLHGQGIPLVTPIDQKKVAAATKLDPKISKNLYTKLGEDVDFLKNRIVSNISRGIATGSTYGEIARNIALDSNMGFNRAMRIARTEGHGVQVQASVDAMYTAQDKGANVVKQWNATLDGATRDSHSMVDGEIRELDEPFSNGMQYPSDPAGGAAEVINCRCTLLQRAKWGLDEDELQTLKDRAEYFGLDKTKNFEEFKTKYLKATDITVTETDKKSILDYMSAKSYVVNDKLRNNEPLTTEETKFTIALDNALDKMPTYSGDLQRSVYFMNDNLMKDFMKDYEIGKPIVYKEYISTTKGSIYNPDAQVQIFIQNSKNGKDISKFNSMENEVLYERNSAFYVINMVKENGVQYILLGEKDE